MAETLGENLIIALFRDVWIGLIIIFKRGLLWMIFINIDFTKKLNTFVCSIQKKCGIQGIWKTWYQFISLCNKTNLNLKYINNYYFRFRIILGTRELQKNHKVSFDFKKNLFLFMFEYDLFFVYLSIFYVIWIMPSPDLYSPMNL